MFQDQAVYFLLRIQWSMISLLKCGRKSTFQTSQESRKHWTVSVQLHLLTTLLREELKETSSPSPFPITQAGAIDSSRWPHHHCTLLLSCHASLASPPAHMPFGRCEFYVSLAPGLLWITTAWQHCRSITCRCDKEYSTTSTMATLNGN